MNVMSTTLIVIYIAMSNSCSFNKILVSKSEKQNYIKLKKVIESSQENYEILSRNQEKVKEF